MADSSYIPSLLKASSEPSNLGKGQGVMLEPVCALPALMDLTAIGYITLLKIYCGNSELKKLKSNLTANTYLSNFSLLLVFPCWMTCTKS